MIKWFALALLTACHFSALGAEFYIAPNGTAEATGSKSDPWDLVTAFNHPPTVHPGDTLWLRGGTYTDGTGRMLVFSRLQGTPDNPIVVRGYPGERATIDGGLALEGGGATWYWGFEITSSDKVRTADADGNIALQEGVICRAPNTKLINLVIHDTKQGMGVWSEAPDTEVYGNLIYHNGWQDNDRGHGHGIYFQNKDGLKLISDNIVFGQFYAGLHGYGSDAAFVKNVTIEGNIVFSNGQLSLRETYVDNILVWPGNPAENIVVRDNMTYLPIVSEGYSRIGVAGSVGHKNVSVTGNYWIGGYIGILLSEWQNAEFRNNTVYNDNGYITWLETPGDRTSANYSWDGNRYYGRSWFATQGPADQELQRKNWNEWRQTTSFDAHSTFQENKPAGVWTFVRPNKFDPNRANIAVYNWDQNPIVNVDLSSMLRAGDLFEIRDAQNYYGNPVVTGRYAGDRIALPMTGVTVAAANGIVPTSPRHTAPEFGAFILIKTENPLRLRRRP